jgi:hypothetical protein
VGTNGLRGSSWLVCVLASFAFCPGIVGAQSGVLDRGELIAQIDEMVKGQMTAGPIAGVSVAVEHRG